jgi:hypothetical protein
MSQTAVNFAIPLKSRSVAADWELAVRMLENTLRSIFNQTVQDFKIAVACHEIPQTIFNGDPRLEFVVVDFLPPISLPERAVDKHRKREMALSRLRCREDAYYMLLDSDDLVSKSLVEFIERDKAPHGYVVKSGYELDLSAGVIRLAPAFHRVCGSSAVLRFRPDDIPETPLRPESRCLVRELMNHNHPTWETWLFSLGRPLAPLPFRGVTYVMNTVENLSRQKGNIGNRRKLLRMVLPARKPSQQWLHEFGFTANGFTADRPVEAGL